MTMVESRAPDTQGGPPGLEQSLRPTILVVDDDSMIRTLVRECLAELRPEMVLEAGSGMAAQAFLSDHAIDIVITDVLMPEMDGRTLMRWAKEHCPRPLWIVLSGLETFDAAIDALQLGAFDFLTKPFEIRRLQVSVRNAMDQIELKRDRERLYVQLEHSNLMLAEKVHQLEGLCHMLEDQAEVIHGDLERAEVIQRALLPKAPPKLEGWCLDTLYRAGNNVGGDVYDVVALDDRYVALVIADAAGHGVAAAMLSVLFKHHLKMWDDEAGTPMAPKAVLAALNTELFADLSSPGLFITAAYALLDTRTGYLRLASAGHPPGIWTRPNGEVKQLERSGPALGLETNPRYRETSVDLEVGDRLLLYTDGVLEGGDSAPTHDDLGAALKSGGSDRASILNELYAAATRDANVDRDDITMILLERCEGISHYDDAQPVRSHEPIVPTNQLKVQQGSTNGIGYLSISGSGTWMRSQAFYDAALEMLNKYDVLTIDLGACEHLDSTFLGTVHEIVMARPEAVRLQRVQPSIRSLFEELSMQGVLAHTSITTTPLPEEMRPVTRAGDEFEQQRRVLRAHEVLASLSDENREQFALVVDSLREELGVEAR
ncbi:MAG: response regulator [Gammaproteobacteria bacterium]|nr:MAG: response regulator [Gammaproteobacteria bacterium]